MGWKGLGTFWSYKFILAPPLLPYKLILAPLLLLLLPSLSCVIIPDLGPLL